MCTSQSPKDLQHLFAGCSIGLLYWLSLVILGLEGRKKRRKKKDWFVIFVLNESCIHVALFIPHTYAWRGRKTLMPKRGELQPCLKEHYQKGMHAQCYYQTFMLKDEKRDDRICQSFLLLHAVILITWWDSCKLLHFWCHCCFLLLSGNDVLGPAKRTAIWGQILAKSGSSSWWGENEFLWARSFSAWHDAFWVYKSKGYFFHWRGEMWPIAVQSVEKIKVMSHWNHFVAVFIRRKFLFNPVSIKWTFPLLQLTKLEGTELAFAESFSRGFLGSWLLSLYPFRFAYASR